MAQLDSLTRTLKGNKHWLVVRPNNNHLQGTITRDINLKHKAEILAKLGSVIKDTEDYEIIISAISKILDYHLKEFPEGLPRAEIQDAASLSGLVQHPTNPNNVTIDSFVFARLKKNIVNGFVIQNDPNALASYFPGKHCININVEGIQSSINRNIATNGKYNYKSTDDYVYSEFEKSIIHEFLHSISDNGSQIGFANYNATDQHIGMNEATTEKIATMISSPKNYRKTNLTLLKTKRSQFLTNIDSNSGYSFQGIVNLIGMLTGVETHRKTLHQQYILGKPSTSILRQDIIDNIDTIYKFSHEKNPINQANLYYTKSMDSYYSAIGITSASVPTSTKTIQITYIDGNNTAHNIPVNCSIYPGNIFKYDIPNNAVISDNIVDNTFSENNIHTQPAGKNGARSAVARYITGYLNTNNISPYSKISLNLSDVKNQPATWRYLIASKTQDDISSWLYTDIKKDITALQTNFSVAKFNEILKRVNAIGDNIVYSIPNDTSKYNLKNIGYVSRLISRRNSTVPVKTITEYYNIRKQLLTIAKANENQFARLSPTTTINLDGVDINFTKNPQGKYAVDKKQAGLVPLLTKMQKYPILASIQNLDTNYLIGIIEEVVNTGIGFNELDEFTNNHVEKTQITYQTICSYLQNEKYKQKDYILTSNILFEYNGVQLNKFIPIKITTQDKNKLQLANSTLRSIQASLNTPYTLSELNAVIATYLVPKFNANISDFTLACNLQDPQLENTLKAVTKDRFIKVGNDVMAVPVAYTQDVYVIGGNAPAKLDSHIEQYLTSSQHNAILNTVQDKKGLVKLIRQGFNHYIHSKKLT
ncbi:MAG: hypothetical protein J6V40_04460, partial [Clostridia bacterium]|nr:hypothetical protein [Clostridia bacterium]